MKDIQRRNVRGNQYVTLKVKIPTNLSERQQELLEEFEGLEEGKTGSPSAKKLPYSVSSAWDRVKEAAATAASAFSSASTEAGGSGGAESKSDKKEEEKVDGAEAKQ